MSEDVVEHVTLASKRFKGILSELTRRSIHADMPSVNIRQSDISVDWNYALLCCSALTSSVTRDGQESALRVAQSCLTSQDTSPDQKAAASLLLDRLGNRPALDLAWKRELVAQPEWNEVPPPLLLDVIRRRLELTIAPSLGATISASVFQRDFWDSAGDSKWLSVSAPTSAGKSYIVKRWFEEMSAEEILFKGLYLVPTRALIEEVSLDLRKVFGISVKIHTLPWSAEIGEFSKEIFVLTQERLHLLQQRDPQFQAHLFFIDEAQKFGDGARGVLLQQVLDEAVRRNPEAQVIFASPLSDNPEHLLFGAPRGAKVESLLSESVTVNQNLLWANQVPGRTTKWELSVLNAEENIPIGSFELEARPSPVSKRLPYVSVALGKYGGNVVYVDGASDAEKAAYQIYEALGPTHQIEGNTEVALLQELVRTAVHSQYSLSVVLGRGVAFHYGNMPLLIKSEIERLFKEGMIEFLVCTSTLLEGVNLPCKNIFIRGPHKGRGNLMSAADFWNLAGRAGRWGKDFQGNIVCIDTDDSLVWPAPPRARSSQPLQRTTDRVLSRPLDLKAFIESGPPSPTDVRQPELESVFSLLAARIAQGVSLFNVTGLVADQGELEDLERTVRIALEGVELPARILVRHAGVNPLAMQRLLDYFANLDHPETYLLPPPESPDAARNYVRSFAICDERLGSRFGNNSGRHWQLSILIAQWMRGQSLARLIDERVSFFRANGRGNSTASVIRSVLDDIEQVARFKAPKYLACYADILNFHLNRTGGAPETESIDLPMMLELGVSRKTEVSLMALGLSRTAVVALAEYLVEDELTPDECLAWLQKIDIDSLGLVRLIAKEIMQIRDDHQRPTNKRRFIRLLDEEDPSGLDDSSDE